MREGPLQETYFITKPSRQFGVSCTKFVVREQVGCRVWLVERTGNRGSGFTYERRVSPVAPPQVEDPRLGSPLWSAVLVIVEECVLF